MKKDTLKIIIIGHVDHGKSTLIGRLLLDTNSLPKERISELKKICKELGKDTELAFLTDQLKEEREKNITIDTTQIFFNTRNRNFVIIDAPGHVEFLKNMITGATQAEAAVLMVDTNEGMMEQTGRHAYIMGMLGIDKVIILFNKMDLINYDEKRFEEVRNKLLNFFKGLGITPSFIIPISAKKGDNVTKRSPNMKWYKGHSFLTALESIKLSVKSEKKPLRLPIQDVYEIDGEKIAVGRVASGVLETGQNVVLMSKHEKTTISSIKLFGEHKTKASFEENIGITTKDPISIKRGEVIASEKESPKLTSRFRGNVFWMSPEPLKLNHAITLRCATQEVKCTPERIEERVNSSTLEILEKDAQELKLNEAGVVIFKSETPIVVENFSFIEELGRFVIERDYALQGAGIITKVSV